VIVILLVVAALQLQPPLNAKNKRFTLLSLEFKFKAQKTLLVKEFRIVLDYSLLHFDRTLELGLRELPGEIFIAGGSRYKTAAMGLRRQTVRGVL